MEIFKADSGVELTVTELQEIIEKDLLIELIDTVASLGGDLYIQGVEEGELPPELLEILDSIMGSDHDCSDEEPTSEDMKMLDILKYLSIKKKY